MTPNAWHPRAAVRADIPSIVGLQRERFAFLRPEDAAAQAQRLSKLLDQPRAASVLVLEGGAALHAVAVLRRRAVGPVVIESVCKRRGADGGPRDDAAMSLFFDALHRECSRLAAGVFSPGIYFNTSNPAMARRFAATARRSRGLRLAGVFGRDHWYSIGDVSTARLLMRHRLHLLLRWLRGEQVLGPQGMPQRISLLREWRQPLRRDAGSESA